MPEPDAFARGFGIYQGMELEGFKLKSLSISHNQIIRYKEYEYPISMTFDSLSCSSFDAQYGRLVDALNKLTSVDKVIKSAYGNPYRCSFGTITITQKGNCSITLSSTGKSYRI